MVNSEIETAIGVKYQQLTPYLNEKTRRLWAATEAAAWGRGGTSVVARATGLSRTTIHAARTELRASMDAAPAAESALRLRRRGVAASRSARPMRLCCPL